MKRNVAFLLMVLGLFMSSAFVASTFAEEATKVIDLKARIKDKATGNLLDQTVKVGIGINAPGVVSHTLWVDNGKLELPLMIKIADIYLEINADGYKPYSKTIPAEEHIDIDVLLDLAEKD